MRPYVCMGLDGANGATNNLWSRRVKATLISDLTTPDDSRLKRVDPRFPWLRNT